MNNLMKITTKAILVLALGTFTAASLTSCNGAGKQDNGDNDKPAQTEQAEENGSEHPEGESHEHPEGEGHEHHGDSTKAGEDSEHPHGAEHPN